MVNFGNRIGEYLEKGLCYGIACHPQTQGVFKQMNNVIEKILTYPIHELNEIRK